ncbi:hypothetical protein FGO68_gene8336 [Halteria grandinella]|uniref:Uncharacterized protein n=1 Tax=Halteria grandinella TaxID=5974 RepID=A0A8J8ND74_HALGN|nr:hypothetical protein FGO68_gene8336 [Halteria grandinella]
MLIDKELDTLRTSLKKERGQLTQSDGLKYFIVIYMRQNLISVTGNMNLSQEMQYVLQSESYPIVDKVYSILEK